MNPKSKPNSNPDSKQVFKLKSQFAPSGDQPYAIKTILEAFKEGKKFQTMLGITGSGKTFTMANIISSLQKKTLVLAHNKTLAAQLFAEFREFFPENKVEYFVSYYDYYQPEAYIPSTDTYIEKDSAINDELDKLRHSTTSSLLERDDVIVVASVSAIYGIGSPDEYASHKITIFKNDTLNRDELLQQLVSNQYTRNDIDLNRGNFRVRGDIVEVFEASEDSKIIRICFFDDIVENIFLVDPLRGHILSEINKATIYPSSHYVVSNELMKVAVKSIQSELQIRLSQLQQENKLVERQRLEQRTLLDLEMLEEIGHCSGIENYSRHFTARKEGEAPPTLIDFFKKDFLIIIDESHMTIPQIRGMYEGDRSRKQTLVNHGFRLPSALDNRPLKFNEFESKLDNVLFVSATPADYELQKVKGEIVELIIRPTGLLDPLIEVRNAQLQIDDMLLEAKNTIKNGGRVLITTLTKKLAEEITSFYASLGLKVRYLHSDISTIERIEIINNLRQGTFDILVGINLLREGLDLPEVSLIGILDADKEGFLRSTRSLIQIIGRAARNESGKVILYAYKETASISQAVSETKRRRQIQREYNEKHGITPKTIQKKIHLGIMEILQKNKTTSSTKESHHNQLSTTSSSIISPIDDLKAIENKIVELKIQMKKLAKKLKFEEAAKLRDEIQKLNEAKLFL
ncbi:MAG: excinuclease ABC subunit UvrB [Oligoflexia bacterium]|nr:excinuclease ABC subunit UvrB [Oligoflexia bacterium]